MNTPIKPTNSEWARRAKEYQSQLTMPTGALGQLLELGQQLSTIQETVRPTTEPTAVVVMAADHGIAEEGVSAYPQEVTQQMVRNFLSGGAAVNVLSRRHNIRMIVVDAGLKETVEIQPTNSELTWVGNQAIERGTQNFLKQTAMTSDQTNSAIQLGRTVVQSHLVPEDVRVVALGEMGIGNSTSAAALAAALTGISPANVTGKGTGVDVAGWRHKVDVIQRALDKHFPNQMKPIEPNLALQCVGGFEIAALVGTALEAAAHRMIVVLDGLISTVAGLVAARLDPNITGYLVASHKGTEPGHKHVLAALGLRPLLDLELRLGEGTGAVLAYSLLQSAADIMRDMATFQSAQVSDRRTQEQESNGDGTNHSTDGSFSE